MAILKITRNLFKIFMCNSLLYFPICDKSQRLFEIPKLDRFPVVCVLYLSLLSSPVKLPCGYIFVVLLYYLFYFDHFFCPVNFPTFVITCPTLMCSTLLLYRYIHIKCFPHPSSAKPSSSLCYCSSVVSSCCLWF